VPSSPSAATAVPTLAAPTHAPSARTSAHASPTGRASASSGAHTATHAASPRPATQQTATHSPTPKPTKPASSGPFVIQALDYYFSPKNPTVPVGTTVKIVDNGYSSHTWTQVNTLGQPASGGFNSGNLDPGQSYTYTFHSAGTYNFVCQYHKSMGMKGSITVH
jgi:plastocyanin